jgi:transposase-like protein
LASQSQTAEYLNTKPRIIGRDGALVDVMLSEHRDLPAVKAFFRLAKAGHLQVMARR